MTFRPVPVWERPGIGGRRLVLSIKPSVVWPLLEDACIMRLRVLRKSQAERDLVSGREGERDVPAVTLS